MTANTQRDPATYSDFFRIFFRHKKKALCFFLIASIATLAVALFWPKSYRSQAMLFVRMGRESVTLDPTATTGGTVQMQASRESEINSVLGLLASRGMSEKVVGRLGVDTVLEVPPENVWFEKSLRTVRRLKSQARDFAKSKISGHEPQVADAQSEDHERAVQLLEDSVSVSAPKNSSVITLTAKAQSAKAAQKLAADWIQSYFEEHINANRTSGSFALFERQTKLIEDELSNTKKQITDLKNRGEIVSAAGQLALLENQKRSIEDEQLVVGRQIKASEGSIAALEKEMKELDRFVLMDKEEGHSNEASDRMREQLYREEIEERALRAQYSADHILVKQKQKQIADLRKVYEDASAMRTHSKSSSNPNWQKLQLDLLSAKVKLSDLKSTDSKLADQRVTIVAKIQGMNRDALEIEKLERHASVLESNYRSYADHLDQARVSDAIEQLKISNVNIVQEATFEPEPVSPKAMIVLPTGLFLAVLGAMALALLCEYFDPRLRSANAVENAAGLPVLIAIPNSRAAKLIPVRS